MKTVVKVQEIECLTKLGEPDCFWIPSLDWEVNQWIVAAFSITQRSFFFKIEVPRLYLQHCTMVTSGKCDLNCDIFSLVQELWHYISRKT